MNSSPDRYPGILGASAGKVNTVFGNKFGGEFYPGGIYGAVSGVGIAAFYGDIDVWSG